MVEMRSHHANEFFFHKFPRYQEVTAPQKPPPYESQTTLPQIQRYLRKLERNYPMHVRIESIGETHYGQTIDMVVICDRPERPKWGVLIDAGIHAREWITNTSALYVISYVLKTRQLLKYFDFYVIPCLNPDGYEYSHTKVTVESLGVVFWVTRGPFCRSVDFGGKT